MSLQQNSISSPPSRSSFGTGGADPVVLAVKERSGHRLVYSTPEFPIFPDSWCANYAWHVQYSQFTMHSSLVNFYSWKSKIATRWNW